MPNTPMKRCSTASVIGEKQTKITVRYYCTPEEQLELKIFDAGEDLEQLEFFCVAGGNANYRTTLKNRLAAPHKVKYTHIIGPRSPTLGYLEK